LKKKLEMRAKEAQDQNDNDDYESQTIPFCQQEKV
jgi:hypothetical protein